MIETFFDFCSGIGGGRLGLEKAGLKCVGRSETSRLADITYKLMHNTDNEHNYGNLKKLGKENLPEFDVLIAGFPCQTFSVIGRQEGFSDDRGQIIFQLSRIMREMKPKCFILENVKGLVTHDGGKTIKRILAELSDSGYVTSYKVLTSLNYRVAQMRQRVYFVGFRKDLNLDYSKFNWPECIDKQPLENFLIDNNIADTERLNILHHYLNNSVNQGKYSVDDLRKMEGRILDTRMNDLRVYDGRCPTLRAQRDGVLYVRNGEIYQLTGYEALLLQGFPKEYADKVKHVVSDRHLLMQSGNAMTVDVIEALGKSIISFVNQNNNVRRDTMVIWKEFESDCTQFLNETFGDYAKFKQEGGSDSTIPDIKVLTNSGDIFYIDAKHCPAQCGQFVLLPNIATRKFEYSPLNVNPLNDSARKIMEYMNEDFDAFREAGTAGRDIDIKNSSEIFADWIIQTYKNKGAEFFITNDYKIVRVEDFSQCFNVSAKYRIKRSGSSSVGKSRFASISKYLEDNFEDVSSIKTIGDKLFIEALSNLHGVRFIYGDYEYMISQRDELYEIRKLSNTYNANVIFSIHLKSNYMGLTENEFIEFLK